MHYSLHYKRSTVVSQASNKQFFGVTDTDNLSSLEDQNSDYNNFLQN